ncbi:MAG: hypothetical protein J5944_03865 [Lentisphaeria bacterium]|nr:hypothetical protein [Lentisphaeria bacterium]
MTESSFFHIFRVAWQRFFRFPAPDGRTQKRLSTEDLSLVVPVTPLAGAAAGLLIWIVLVLAGRIAGHTAAALLAAAVIPPVLEYASGERGIRALFAFLRMREQGYSPMEILASGLDGEDEPGPLILPEKVLLPAVLLLFRSCLYAVICLRSGGLWFLFTWTGVFLLFAELSLLPDRSTGRIPFPIRENGRNLHIFCAAGVFLIAGLAVRDLLGAGIGFFAAWGLAHGAAVLQRRTGGRTDRALTALYGLGAEILLLFLGILLYAG